MGLKRRKIAWIMAVFITVSLVNGVPASAASETETEYIVKYKESAAWLMEDDSVPFDVVTEAEMKPLKDFDDTRYISDWAVKAFRWAVDAGIINGVGNRKISPKTDASRAQVATMLMRYDSITQ